MHKHSTVASLQAIRRSLLNFQGHAGTVPMKLRQDAAAAAAEAVVWIERLCGGGDSEDSPAAPVKDDSLVCTTGSMALWPGASNVIAGAANFSVDIRWVPSTNLPLHDCIL